MHMICPFMPILPQQSSQNFLHISCRKKITAPLSASPFYWRPGGICFLPLPATTRSATTSSKLGVQFFGVTTNLQKKIDRSTQFGAVGYHNHTLFIKKLRKKLGSIQILGSPVPFDPPVVAPMATTAFNYVLFNVANRP